MLADLHGDGEGQGTGGDEKLGREEKTWRSTSQDSGQAWTSDKVQQADVASMIAASSTSRGLAIGDIGQDRRASLTGKVPGGTLRNSSELFPASEEANRGAPSGSAGEAALRTSLKASGTLPRRASLTSGPGTPDKVIRPSSTTPNGPGMLVTSAEAPPEPNDPATLARAPEAALRTSLRATGPPRRGSLTLSPPSTAPNGGGEVVTIGELSPSPPPETALRMSLKATGPPRRASLTLRPGTADKTASPSSTAPTGEGKVATSIGVEASPPPQSTAPGAWTPVSMVERLDSLELSVSVAREPPPEDRRRFSTGAVQGKQDMGIGVTVKTRRASDFLVPESGAFAALDFRPQAIQQEQLRGGIPDQHFNLLVGLQERKITVQPQLSGTREQGNAWAEQDSAKVAQEPVVPPEGDEKALRPGSGQKRMTATKKGKGPGVVLLLEGGRGAEVT